MPKQSEVQKLIELEAESQAAYEQYLALRNRVEEVKKTLDLPVGMYLASVGGRPGVLQVRYTDYGTREHEFKMVTELT